MGKRLNSGLNLRQAPNAYIGSASDLYMYMDPLVSAFPSYAAKVLVQGERENKTKHNIEREQSQIEPNR